MLIAKVIVDVPAYGTDHIFDYDIPDVFADMLTVGMRVTVPFGSRKILGFVVAIEEQQEAPSFHLKAIDDMLDVYPVLTEEMITVGFWLAEETLCFRIMAFQAMLPAALKASYQKELRLTDEQSLASLPASLQPIFSQSKKVFWKDMSQSYPQLLTDVRSLIEEGVLDVIQHVKDRLPTKKEQVIELAVSKAAVADYRETLRTTAHKQGLILDDLLQRDEPVSTKQLLNDLEVSRSTIRTLAKNDMIRLTYQEVYRDPFSSHQLTDTHSLSLTEEQHSVMTPIMAALRDQVSETFLLHGVTGSGKTEIYLQAIQEVLHNGQEAVVLVPEISLTPQMVARFRGRFGEQVAVMHSGLSKGEKYDEWRKIRRGEVSVVVGARSAVFAPFSNIGIIIIDEEHESSYKQEEQPRYHARDVAIYRARMQQCPVILGSATPALASYARAQKGVYQLLSLTERINQKAMPAVTTVDMRQELKQGNRSMFSHDLYQKLQDRLEKQEQSVLLLNRRGFSTFMICRDCGYVTECPHCDISLTYHKSHHMLKCHYCGYQQELPQTCPSCESEHIRFFGTGTQKVEEELYKIFPEARIIRMDVDTTSRKGMHEVLLNRFADQQADILLGTQMIAKGLDFPNVTLVGILAADSMLHLPDFRASERTFQLLTQVSGRAGRHELTGEVIVQTYTPDHYSIALAAQHDYLAFYRQEMIERRQHHYPPYYFLALITVTGEDLLEVSATAEKTAGMVKQQLSSQAVVLGPVTAAIPRIKDRYRYQCVIKYKREPNLHQVLADITQHYGKQYQHKDLMVSVDLKPQMLM